MLSQLGVETFVGGNLGNPLSEAALQCLASTSLGHKFQVILVVWLVLTLHWTVLMIGIFSGIVRKYYLWTSCLNLLCLKIKIVGYILMIRCFPQVAVVEVSSYQMEIPNKLFCPSVSGAWNFCFLTSCDSNNAVSLPIVLSSNVIGIFSGCCSAKPYTWSFGKAQNNEKLCND